MNELTERYGERGFVCLGFPTNQFGHQENLVEEEIMNSLKHVRPGAGYEPKFPMMEKTIANGEGTHPVFEYLKTKLPFPEGEGCCGPIMGSAAFPMGGMLWEPVKRYDLSWNFEKFLIGRDGEPVKRFSPRFETIKLAESIEALL
jgi:glutathione peroxidase